METTRILVDKEKVVIDNKQVMRLYFYDIPDGYVLMYDAPILKSRGVPLLDNKNELEEVEERSTEEMTEPLPSGESIQDDVVQPLIIEDEEEDKYAL